MYHDLTLVLTFDLCNIFWSIDCWAFIFSIHHDCNIILVAILSNDTRIDFAFKLWPCSRSTLPILLLILISDHLYLVYVVFLTSPFQWYHAITLTFISILIWRMLTYEISYHVLVIKYPYIIWNAYAWSLKGVLSNCTMLWHQLCPLTLKFVAWIG